MCHRPGSHAPLPAPGRRDGSAALWPTATPPTQSLNPLTMLAGKGVAQVSWLLGSVASRSHSSGHGPGRLGESPAHATTTGSPPRAPPAPLKGAHGPLRGPPEAIHRDLGPPQGNAKAENGVQRRPHGAPRLGPTPEREAAGPGRDSPASAARRGDGPRPRLKGQRLPGPGRRGRLRREARGPVLSSPPLSSRRAPSASLRATSSRCSPLAATPCQQPNAPEVASTRRPLSSRPAAALEPDQSGIK